MTETMIDVPGVIAKSDDADFLRELIKVAAQRLMDIKVAAVCGAGHGERGPEREGQRHLHSGTNAHDKVAFVDAILDRIVHTANRAEIERRSMRNNPSPKRMTRPLGPDTS